MRKKVLMGFFPLALCLLLLLTGCEQPGPGIGSMQVSPSQAPPSSNLPVSQKSGNTAFVFDASIIDPQNMVAPNTILDYFFHQSICNAPSK